MRILVVGAGAYVTGRGTDGPGTVLPALAEASKSLAIDGVTVCATRPDGAGEVAAAAEAVNRQLDTALDVSYRVADELLSDGSAGDGEGDLAGFDAAIVSVPDHLHADIGRRVLAAGLHCLMVKPLTPGLADARELAELAEERGLHAMVELHKRWDEANLVVRRLIEEGRLGQLAYATVEYSQRIGVPTETFRAWAHRTNIFQYLGVHYVDLMYFLTGYRPVEVLAAGRRGVLSAQGVDTWDSVHALTRWRAPGGDGEGTEPFLCQLAIGWIDPATSTAMSDQRYLLVGGEGRIECDQKNRGLDLITGDGGASAINPYFSQVLADPGPRRRFAGYGCQSVVAFLGDVADVLGGTARPGDFHDRRPTFRQALVSTAVIDAANRSMDSGGTWISVDGEALDAAL